MSAIRYFARGSRSKWSARACLAGILLLLAYGPASAGDPNAFALAPGGGIHAIAPQQDDARNIAAPGPLNSAVDSLNQAALQSGLASDFRELGLLRSAREDLRRAQDSACCATRDRIARLDADIAQVIAGGGRQSATLRSTGGPISDTPNRDMLIALAKEGQSVLRGDPAGDGAWPERALQVARAQAEAPAAGPSQDRAPGAIDDPAMGGFGDQRAMPLFAMRF